MARMDSEPHAGQPAVMTVTFIEDRNGRAIVRLPNGSKTTVDYGSVVLQPGTVHFVSKPGGAEEAWCQECDWQTVGENRAEAAARFSDHVRQSHGG